MSDVTRTSPEFRAYERARDAVLALTQSPVQTGTAAPSTYWTEELENIDYLIEASPLIVRKLRHHAFHITGIRPYDYRTKGDARRVNFEARLRALQEIDQGRLLVPESPALGGFGYEIDGRLVNVDTLKFYEVLVGMERGGLLEALRAHERPVVCEIGAGWGGFAYQLRTIVPRARLVIVDFAELFLFSGTYLGALFPEATLAYVGTPQTPSIDDAREADIIFVPHTMVRQVARRPPDLVVNMVSFQEMTGSQVRAYAALAADAGCPLLYSFNRERSPYNTELVSVSEALSERYRLTEVTVLGTDYTTAMKKPPKATATTEKSEFNYRHYVGRLDRDEARTSVARASSSLAEGEGEGGPESPRVVFGMTLYNNARNLRSALDSLLAQTVGDFAIVMLDDASKDESEAIAREYEARHPHVRYFRHQTRQAMIATWKEVAEIAMREYPQARYFAWVSDHDEWHPRWLERMRAQLDADAAAVLAYPITRRIGQDGIELDKGPRLFETTQCRTDRERWRHFCHHGIGAGDMVYGLMRADALGKAGIFRRVLRPDRLLMAELTLSGTFHQVQEVLWFRRESTGTSVERQRHTLVLPGDEPRWFGAPPWIQHSLVLWREYARPVPPPLPISRARWAGMLVRYQVTYGWRHFRKTGVSHAIGRGVDNIIWTRKRIKHYTRLAIFHTLVGTRRAWGHTRRGVRVAIYETLVTMHRAIDVTVDAAQRVRKTARHYWHHALYHVLVTARSLRGQGGQNRP